MSADFRLTSVNETILTNTLQDLGKDQATGVLKVSFGRHLPSATISVDRGAFIDADFGELKGRAVLDLLICQAPSIKEIVFKADSSSEPSAEPQGHSIARISDLVVKGVNGCAARPGIFGSLPLTVVQEDRTVDSVFKVIHDFENYRTMLDDMDFVEHDGPVPLLQCRILQRALKAKVLVYKTPLVSLESVSSLFDLVAPLEKSDSDHLNNYLHTLLPHRSATHMSMEKFYALGSVVESIAFKRSNECGEQVRKQIYKLVKGPATTN